MKSLYNKIVKKYNNFFDNIEKSKIKSTLFVLLFIIIASYFYYISTWFTNRFACSVTIFVSIAYLIVRLSKDK